MKNPILLLEEEHNVIRRVLAVIEQETRRIDTGALPDADLLRQTIQFFAGFADGRHHGKEERFLFAVLASKKDIIRDGPVKVLSSEHESGRYFVKELREGLVQLEAGDQRATARIRRALQLYAQMLHKHIAKEEEILFLLAQVLLSDNEMEELGTEFQGADEKEAEGSLEKYLEIVDQLERRESRSI